MTFDPQGPIAGPTLLIIGIVATALAAWLAGNALLDRWRDPDPHGREHALIVSLGLLVASFAQVLTGLGFVGGSEDLRGLGAILARGALLGTLLYLVLRYPRRPQA